MFKRERMEIIREEIKAWIRKYFDDNPVAHNVVIGISGGVDSSVVAALCTQALGRDRVIGVLMPQGEQHDIEYSRKLVNHLRIKSYEINIGPIVDSITKNITDSIGRDANEFYIYKTNTPARVRMTILYGVAATNHGFVVNTCNRSENYIGYSTKFGDHAGDFSPLWNLTKTEIVELAKILGLPHDLVHKDPEDGLSGKTDEENFGFTYLDLDVYLLYNIKPSQTKLEKIERMHQAGIHKMIPMPAYKPEE